MEFIPPILQREFVVRSRDRSTYLIRLVTAVVSFAMALGFTLLPSLLGIGISRNGSLGFTVCSWFLWLFCVVEGIRVSSDCLSGEKREGTIGLLFLTRMGGFDVVAGKLSSGLIGSLFSLLAALPILGFLMLSGGVTGSEFLRICLALVSTLVLAMALGVLISARSFYAGRSLLASGGILLAWTLISVIVSAGFGVFFPSSFSLFVGGFDAAYQTDPLRFWTSLLTVWLVAGLCFVSSGFVIGRHWRAGPRRVGILEKWESSRLKRWLGFVGRPPISATPPITWLAERSKWIKQEKRFAGLVLAIGVPLAFLPSASFGLSSLVSWILIVGFVWEGLRFFMGSRSSGCLELILTTPTGVDEMLFQLHLHSRRFAIYGTLLAFGLGIMEFAGSSLLDVLWPAFGAVQGAATLGMIGSESAWINFAMNLGKELLVLGFAAIASYFWFYGVYWYSLWRGAIGHSIANAIGWILIITVVGSMCFLWVGSLLLMIPLMGVSWILRSGGVQYVMLISTGISSVLIILYFNRLARVAKKKLRHFLSASPPQVHGMTAQGLHSFR